MESLTYIKNIKITPKKLRMIRDIIVRMKPQDALDHLLYDTSKASNIYYKAIHSAVSNATQVLKVGQDVLKFKLLTIEEGRTLRRFHAGSKGNAKPIKKSFSHIKIIMEPMQSAPVKKEIAEKKPIKIESKMNVKTANKIKPVKEVKKKIKKVTKSEK